MIIIDDDGIMHDVVPKKVLEQIKDEIVGMCEMYPDGELYVAVEEVEKIIDKHLK